MMTQMEGLHRNGHLFASLRLAPILWGTTHTDKDIGHFTVNENGGAYVGSHEGGGKFACCVSVPKPWRPGFSVTIGWTDEYDKNYQERVVPVPKYDTERTAQLSVHFLRNGHIKVFVPPYGLGNPNYPLKGEEAQLKSGVDPVNQWKR